MTRALLAVLGAGLVAAASAPAASAHPLGNFSVNHLTEVSVSADRVDVRYLLDQAEVPTFQERGRAPAAVLAAKRAEVQARLTVLVDGRRVALRPAGRARIAFPDGQGGLRTTRVELPLVARLSERPHLVRVADRTFPDRVGWRAIVARPGHGTAVRSTAPSGDPTGGLRGYPRDALSSPRDERTATLRIRKGDGSLAAPATPGGAVRTSAVKGEDGFAGLLDDAAAGEGVLLFLLLAAFGWGAVHALSPGHGKAMVAAYLVGTRGTARHAVALGATVTVTHTAGVFALGLVTLALSQHVLPEDLYPWLELTSGLLVLLVGAGVLRGRLRRARAARAHAHAHHHDHPDRITTRGLVAMGTSAGLIPCPSALVVLLGALSQHEVALGLGLIAAFSLGLAATLTALGLAVVWAGRLASRLAAPAWLSTVLPALSALAIVGAGCLLTARAVPGVL